MATTNFGFDTLSGSETAGYTSINTLITSIDSLLKQRVFAADKTWANTGGDGDEPSANEVMIFSGTWGNADGYWKAGLIAAANIASDAITEAKIINNAVTTSKINAGAITTAKLADDSVTAAKLADNSVTTATILDGQVTAAKLDEGLTTQILPAGMIAPFAGSTAPSGWLLCNGDEVSRSAYNGLFDVIDTTYGDGDGENTFLLPDMSGRVPVGKSADVEFDALNEKGGSKTVTLTGQESGIAAHTHTVASNTGVSGNNNTPGYSVDNGNAFHSHGTGVENANHSHTTGFRQKRVPTVASGGVLALVGPTQPYDDTSTYTSGGISANHAHSTDAQNATHAHTLTNNGHTHNVVIDTKANTNASTAHNNLQPYITLNYIIKY